MHTQGHRGWKGRGGRQQAEVPSAADAAAWFTGRLPDGWFVSAPEITVDREEILVVGELPPLAEEFDDDAARAAAEAGRISRFREETRDDRIEIARQAEHRYQRKVAWGARVGGTRELFTTLSVPVMTRLRQPERQVLDTLVDSGVARSRSEALAWAVRLVGEHAESWLRELRTAMSTVDELRAKGPDLD
jgi:Arc/MetJ-type ribon-helix-helix transcriptional regulator